MAIEKFWNACESHGKLVALSRSLEKGSLPDFVASIGDEGIKLAAFSLLQRLAIAHDEPTTQAQILAENSEFVADLLKCESISRSLVKVLHECTHTLKIISTIPRSKAEIRKATGRLQAGSLWLSHSLWLMDINTRCQFIPSLTRKTEGDLRHKNKDALFCDPQITRYQNGKFYSQNAVIAAILPAEF